MPNDEGGGAEQKRHEGVSEPNIDSTLNFSGNERRGAGTVPQEGPVDGSVPPLALSITIFQPYDISKPNISASKSAAPEGGDKIPGMAASKKGFLSRSGSYQEQCRLNIFYVSKSVSSLDAIILSVQADSCKCTISRIRTKCKYIKLERVNNWVWRINTAYIMGQEHERVFIIL
ncbi:hypothetical protein BHM03_00051104, partial [Ensete ventricosum]